MKRILIAGVAGLMLSLFSAQGAWAFGWKDVQRMYQDGISDSLIIQKIEHSGKSFHLGASDMHALKQAGVSDEVISAMLRTEDQGDGDGYYGGYYHPRVFVGLGFGYYGHYGPYYGGYWPYRYGRYYTPRYYGGYYRPGGFGSSRPRYNYGTPRSGRSGPVTRHR